MIVLVVHVKLLLATPMQNTTETWTQTARKILLNVKLVTNAQKDRVHSNHYQPVLSQTVHLWLHVTIVTLVTTVPPPTTQMDKTMTTVFWIKVIDSVFMNVLLEIGVVPGQKLQHDVVLVLIIHIQVTNQKMIAFHVLLKNIMTVLVMQQTLTEMFKMETSLLVAPLVPDPTILLIQLQEISSEVNF